MKVHVGWEHLEMLQAKVMHPLHVLRNAQQGDGEIVLAVLR